MGLIYQSNVETSADPSAQINLRQSSRVIYETFVCRQSHHTKDRTLINVAAENNRHLNITPLKTPGLRPKSHTAYVGTTFEFERTSRPLKKYVLYSMNVGSMNELGRTTSAMLILSRDMRRHDSAKI